MPIAADAEHRELVSRIDRAVKRGALHRNNGARKKARAAQLLSRLSSPGAPRRPRQRGRALTRRSRERQREGRVLVEAAGPPPRRSTSRSANVHSARSSSSRSAPFARAIVFFAAHGGPPSAGPPAPPARPAPAVRTRLCTSRRRRVIANISFEPCSPRSSSCSEIDSAAAASPATRASARSNTCRVRLERGELLDLLCAERALGVRGDRELLHLAGQPLLARCRCSPPAPWRPRSRAAGPPPGPLDNPLRHLPGLRRVVGSEPLPRPSRRPCTSLCGGLPRAISTSTVSGGMSASARSSGSSSPAFQDCTASASR